MQLTLTNFDTMVLAINIRLVCMRREQEKQHDKFLYCVCAYRGGRERASTFDKMLENKLYMSNILQNDN